MQKELFSQKTKERDAVLVSLCGGVIGIIGVIAEYKILSASAIDLDAAFKIGTATFLGGVSLIKGHKIININTYIPSKWK